MFVTSAIHRPLFGRVLGVIAVVATVACGASPGAPTASSPTAATALPMSGGQSTADFAQCLGGSGDPSCFSAGGMMRTASLDSSAAVGAPTNLAASVSGTTVILSWTPPATGDPVSFYVIEAGTAPGLSNLVQFALTTPGLTAPGIPFGVYYVRIRAAGAAGFGPPSNEIVVTVGGCAGPPSGLVVASQSAGTISLAWSPPASGSPTSYTIVAGSAPGLANLVIYDTRSPSPSLVVNAVPAGSYYVRVHSNSSCGISAASNEVLVFAVGSSGDVQVSVSWDAPSDVDLHVVEPSGEDIYYGHPASATGGQLDVDSNAGVPSTGGRSRTFVGRDVLRRATTRFASTTGTRAVSGAQLPGDGAQRVVGADLLGSVHRRGRSRRRRQRRHDWDVCPRRRYAVVSRPTGLPGAGPLYAVADQAAAQHQSALTGGLIPGPGDVARRHQGQLVCVDAARELLVGR